MLYSIRDSKDYLITDEIQCQQFYQSFLSFIHIHGTSKTKYIVTTTFRRDFLFFLISLFLYVNSIFLTIPSETPTNTTNETTLQTLEEDITGDGWQETIQLHGTRLAENSNYFHDVTFSISSPFTKTWKKTLPKGYDPKLKLLQLTNSQQKDFFYEVALNEDKTERAYELFRLNQGKLSNIPLPVQENIRINLEDNFLITVKLPLQKKIRHIKIDEFKNDLIKSGLYNKQGKLMKETNIIPENIAFMEPVFLNKQNGYALKTIQYIKGINANHTLGSIHTIWHMQNGEWIILQTEWKEQT